MKLLNILALAGMLSIASLTPAHAGAGMPNVNWQPWMLPSCQAAWDSAYGVQTITGINLHDMTGRNGTNRDMGATTHTPSQILNIRNGWPVIRFTNNTMWITNTAPWTVTNNNTIFVIAQCFGATNTTHIFLANWQTNNQQMKLNGTGTGFTPTAFATGNTVGTTGSSWGAAAQSWFCGMFNNASGTFTFRTNGVSAGGGSGDTVGNTVASAIGNVLNPNIFLTADFMSELVFSPALATGDRNNVEAWASTRGKLGF